MSLLRGQEKTEDDISELFNQKVEVEFRNPCAISFKDVKTQFVATDILEIIEKEPLINKIFEKKEALDKRDCIEVTNTLLRNLVNKLCTEKEPLIITVDSTAKVDDEGNLLLGNDTTGDTHSFAIFPHKNNPKIFLFSDQTGAKEISFDGLMKGLAFVSERSCVYPAGFYLK